jgi:hypothetical protein
MPNRFYSSSSLNIKGIQCAQRSASKVSNYCLHSIALKGNFVLPAEESDGSVSFHRRDLGEPRRLPFTDSRYATCHSGWHVRCYHRGHVQSNVEQYYCLHNRCREQLPLPDKCQSMERFLKSKFQSLNALYSV